MSHIFDNIMDAVRLPITDFLSLNAVGFSNWNYTVNKCVKSIFEANKLLNFFFLILISFVY
jgi:hypothetical protein